MCFVSIRTETDLLTLNVLELCKLTPAEQECSVLQDRPLSERNPVNPFKTEVAVQSEFTQYAYIFFVLAGTILSCFYLYRGLLVCF